MLGESLKQRLSQSNKARTNLKQRVNITTRQIWAKPQTKDITNVTEPYLPMKINLWH